MMPKMMMITILLYIAMTCSVVYTGLHFNASRRQRIFGKIKINPSDGFKGTWPRVLIVLKCFKGAFKAPLARSVDSFKMSNNQPHYLSEGQNAKNCNVLNQFQWGAISRRVVSMSLTILWFFLSKFVIKFVLGFLCVPISTDNPFWRGNLFLERTR